MSRWKPILDTINGITSRGIDSDNFMDSFSKKRNYEAQTKEEQAIMDEFSLVTSSMIILIHIAKADTIMHPEERKQIIDDLIFQFEQRPYEYHSLSIKFGKTEREIITNMYNIFLTDYENKKLDIQKILDKINLIFQNNLEKRIYIIRLCYYCALSDSHYEESEDIRIKDIAAKLKVPESELARIEKEVKEDLNK